MSTRIPCPTARNAVPIAAVVFPLPGPVFTMMSPRRTSFIVREFLIVTAGHVWRDTGGPRSPLVQTGWACKPNGCNVLPIWKNDVAKVPGLRNATQLRASQRTFIFCLHLGERYETSSQLGLERAGWVVARLIPGFHVSGPLAALIAALAIGFINATLGAFLKIITFPLTLLTLGIFWFVINALMLELASAIVPGFHVDSFKAAFWGAIVLSLVNMFFRWLLGTSRQRS